MTLRETELIGKKLVKHGFFRSNMDHHNYRCHGLNIEGGITITFIRHGSVWSAVFVHGIDMHTIVEFHNHEAVFTPEWIIEEHNKLQAMFKFLRS